jgi:hypothetical protein
MTSILFVKVKILGHIFDLEKVKETFFKGRDIWRKTVLKSHQYLVKKVTLKFL